MQKIILIMIFFSTLSFVYMGLKIFMSQHKHIYRLSAMTTRDDSNDLIKERKRENVRFGIIARSIEKTKFFDRYNKKIQMDLLRANIKLYPQEFLAIKIILPVLTMSLCFILINISKVMILLALIATPIAWIIPSLVVNLKINKRMKILNAQLCDAITLIANSIKAGFSFFQSIDVLIKEMSGPIAEEFAILQNEISLGVDTESALQNLVDRVKSDDLELAVVAISIQRQVGGNLAEVLENISSTIRERIRIKGEVKTVTAQGRMSGLIIALLPIGISLVLALIDPNHIKTLFVEPLGIVMFIYCCIMEFVGVMMIKKIVDVKV